MYLEDQISECHGGSSVSLSSFEVSNQIVHLIKTPTVSALATNFPIIAQYWLVQGTDSDVVSKSM